MMNQLICNNNCLAIAMWKSASIDNNEECFVNQSYLLRMILNIFKFYIC